jgi:hypothetical protein
VWPSGHEKADGQPRVQGQAPLLGKQRLEPVSQVVPGGHWTPAPADAQSARHADSKPLGSNVHSGASAPHVTVTPHAWQYVAAN